MKKLSAIILAVLMALTLSVSAMAYEANEVVLVMMNSAGDPVVSDPVAIAADGEYTFKIEGLDFSKDQIQTIYIKCTLLVCQCNADRSHRRIFQ